MTVTPARARSCSLGRDDSFENPAGPSDRLQRQAALAEHLLDRGQEALPHGRFRVHLLQDAAQHGAAFGKAAHLRDGLARQALAERTVVTVDAEIGRASRRERVTPYG